MTFGKKRTMSGGGERGTTTKKKKLKIKKKEDRDPRQRVGRLSSKKCGKLRQRKNKKGRDSRLRAQWAGLE